MDNSAGVNLTGKTKNSPEPCQGGTLERGARQDPPMGAQSFKAPLAGTQTRNSPNPKA